MERRTSSQGFPADSPRENPPGPTLDFRRPSGLDILVVGLLPIVETGEQLRGNGNPLVSRQFESLTKNLICATSHVLILASSERVGVERVGRLTRRERSSDGRGSEPLPVL